jgi:hypothetical protein
MKKETSGNLISRLTNIRDSIREEIKRVNLEIDTLESEVQEREESGVCADTERRKKFLLENDVIRLEDCIDLIEECRDTIWIISD